MKWKLENGERRLSIALLIAALLLTTTVGVVEAARVKDMKQITVLTENPQGRLAWSPLADGFAVAMPKVTDVDYSPVPYDLIFVNLSDGQWYPISGGPNLCCPAWNPRSGNLAFIDTRGVNILIDSSRIILPLPEYIREADVVWDPNGTRLLVYDNSPPDNESLWVVDADGANLTRIANITGTLRDLKWIESGIVAVTHTSNATLFWRILPNGSFYRRQIAPGDAPEKFQDTSGGRISPTGEWSAS